MTEKIELTETVTCTITCDPEQAEDARIYLDKYPLIKRAVLLQSFAKDGYMAQREMVGCISAYDIVRVGKLIDRVNPRFPGDSFSPATLLALLIGSFVDTEEIDIIEKAMPDYSGDRRIRIQASPNGSLSVTFEHSMKHSGMYYEVAFSGHRGLNYPVAINLTTYMDMDDLRNHWESDGDCGCPERWQHWICPHCEKECESIDPAYCKPEELVACYHCEKETPWGELNSWAEGDCNCESEVAYSGELIVPEDFDAEKVGAWIEEHLFEGQQNPPEGEIDQCEK